MIQIFYYLTRWADCENVTFVALSPENEIIGTVMLRFSSERHNPCKLWNLHVSSPERKKGLGLCLLEQAVDFARKRGSKEVQLEWDARDTDGWVLDWYKRQGFKVEDGYNCEVRLAKQLK